MGDPKKPEFDPEAPTLVPSSPPKPAIPEYVAGAVQTPPPDSSEGDTPIAYDVKLE